jgi:hypothetical protein
MDKIIPPQAQRRRQRGERPVEALFVDLQRRGIMMRQVDIIHFVNELQEGFDFIRWSI